MTTAQAFIVDRKSKVAQFWTLIKPLQIGLLLATGVAGYMSAHGTVDIPLLLVMSVSLFLSISGSTIMNMWHDHDIDAKMKRTQKRPAASGELTRTEVFNVGMAVTIVGVGWAVTIDPLYGLVVFAGWFFDVVVYTLWLKRITCWSILWGGISGAMPILAGRVLALSWPSTTAGPCRPRSPRPCRRSIWRSCSAATARCWRRPGRWRLTRRRSWASTSASLDSSPSSGWMSSSCAGNPSRAASAG